MKRFSGLFVVLMVLATLLPMGLAQAAAPATESISPDRLITIPFPGPAGFVTKIDNPYLPLKPGTTLICKGA